MNRGQRAGVKGSSVSFPLVDVGRSSSRAVTWPSQIFWHCLWSLDRNHDHPGTCVTVKRRTAILEPKPKISPSRRLSFVWDGRRIAQCVAGLCELWSILFNFNVYMKKKRKKTYCGWKKCLFFRQGGLHFGATELYCIFPRLSICSEKRIFRCCFWIQCSFFLWDVRSALYISLSVLYPVYFVVRCCETSVVCWCIFLFCSSCVEFLMKKEKNNHNQHLCVFIRVFDKRSLSESCLEVWERGQLFFLFS